MSENVFIEEKPQEQETINFATVTGVYNDGLTLLFDGETEPTQKRYKCNAFAVFKVNDRVRVIKDSGTYVVEYSVGNPKKSFNADTATTADEASYSSKTGSAYNLLDDGNNNYKIWLRYSNGYMQIYSNYKGKWVNLVAY